MGIKAKMTVRRKYQPYNPAFELIKKEGSDIDSRGSKRLVKLGSDVYGNSKAVGIGTRTLLLGG